MNMNRAMVAITLVVIGLFAIFLIANNKGPIPYTGDFVPKTSPTSAKIMPPTPVPTKESATVSAESTIPESVVAKIQTSKGVIEALMIRRDAPNTILNFVKKAKNGYYNNLTFHRVEDWVIQGGDPLGNGTGGGEIPTELNDKPFIAGSLGVARRNDIRVSNDSQFFITKKETSSLNRLYTNFGIVTNGMDVVNKIEVGDRILGITVQ